MKTAFHYHLLSLTWLLLPPGTNADGTLPMNTTTPVCSDDEELFQLQFIMNSWKADVSYRIFTESTNVTHDECIMCSNDDDPEAGIPLGDPDGNIQMCLPRDECHTLTVGRMGRWISSCFSGDGEELLVRWGDQTLLSDNAYHFESIDFGDGCQEDSYMDSYCDSEDEILFEFFLDRRGDRGYPLFSYDLTEVPTSENRIVHLESEAPVKEDAFIYERKCVPRISCLEFHMGYPSNTTSTNWYDYSSYSIRLDGVTYSDGDLMMGLESFAGDKLNQTTSLGNNCTVENMCNTTTEDLFEMEFTVAATERMVEWCEDNDYVSAFHSYEFSFWFEGQNKNDNADYYVSSSSYESFKVNRTYAFISCIPNDECAEVYFNTENPVTNYKIFQNGEELTERFVHTAEDDFSEGLTTTGAGAWGQLHCLWCREESWHLP
mmetsp:Transcript_32801/g.37731  ORF Transcript_32801/g.37731 Transcript_32801/m.37731 type:complete len:433 (+) Transcript_32801:28-1326(+)